MSNPVTQSPFPPAAAMPAFETAQRSFEQVRADRERFENGASRQITQAATAKENGPITVEGAIASAAQQTGIDFDFLIAQAQVESAMDPSAKARTSSATGLYQFIEGTWLETMQRHGDRFGLGNVSSQIRTSQNGNAYVSDPGTRKAILDLRNDPQIASLMAAGLAEDNRAHLAPILGRQPEHSELYLAHFLGAGGAGRFLSALESNPQANASQLFRRPAAANRPVFYEVGGTPRSLQGVMDYLSGKLETARSKAPQSIPDSYAIAALVPPQIAGGNNTNPAPQRPPYMIADERVFQPQSPPVITGRNRPTIAASPPLELARPGSQQPISNMLRSTFDAADENDAGQNGVGQNGVSRATQDQIARAYEQLKALGF
ncbi:MAG: transglycosylase SLT domain-containing protein [Erythrobacter sp.]|uniref:transglycosylase SLT domain-containing protein n=1 Tax=Erythrobacter sp. TaxID=1042 RepID=UPI0032982C83